MAGVLTTIFLDTRRPRKDGTYPVKLRLTHLRERKYFPTAYFLTAEDFAKTQAERARGEFKEIQIALRAMEAHATEVIKKLPVFSFDAFERAYSKVDTYNDVFDSFSQAVNRLVENGQVGTAKTYENAQVSLLSFILKEPTTQNKGLTLKEATAKKENLLKKKKPLPFAAITPAFLKDYERWMIQSGKSSTTIGIYLRNLRALFNEAMASGDIPAEIYPFGKRKYQIPAGRNTKKALTKQEIAKIFAYEPRHDSEAKARDYWCFSYLCNGINLKDVARLRYRQVTEETISFIRAKTERTTRHDQKVIKVPLLAESAKIIERWGNKPALANSYVFPILQEGHTPDREMAAVTQAIKSINRYMKRIAAEVGIEMNVTTYSARHSFSTVLKRAGVSTAMISESLGHSSEKTTQSYLDSFEDDAKRQIASHLTDF
ncbi:phage integrase SAM-like domain-containing protein [Rufibacter glacialis]|uniref:Phage integrase SAM-like domain-containing protein n=1 Tax=Rufibacter glacialis TaxID=1259555 RepID=A0A5M8QKI6_9BACT|nr:site-specific integrase [Rufibacter glacialis]KAA6435494.1 site-specific integrase [Rufibacter glacialis]GGK64020.1 integrase [Rufibacter glacialis]